MRHQELIDRLFQERTVLSVEAAHTISNLVREADTLLQLTLILKESSKIKDEIRKLKDEVQYKRWV